ncbi:DNA damage-binding protein 1 [Grifola frondosa]|uniref:DNA damage-binding protein 1 n=1 Tax=Grifola frondosa TaxID=5627 RepID=A0A1C7LXW2_GRIFR|nr:DNA damage-binding protein 1 [Grifola frondosa]
MRVVATFHPPSSVTRSLKCHLTTDPAVEHLVVARINRLEVHSLQPDGLRHECSLEVWGRIVALRSIPTNDNDRSNILVMTDHPDPKLIVLAYVVEAGLGNLVTKGQQSLFDRASRHAEFITDVQVDPSGEVAVACCYVGKLKVVKLKDGEFEQPFDVSTPELNLLAFTFLHAERGMYTLAILHLDHQQRLQLLSRDVNTSDPELSALHSTLLPSTMIPSSTLPLVDIPPILIAIPPYTSSPQAEEASPADHLGGLLVVGGRKVLFFEHASKEKQEDRKDKQRRAGKRLSSAVQSEVAKAKEKENEREGRKVKQKASVKWPWSEVTAWCSVDDEGRRFFLGDAYGRLAMLAFDDRPGLTLLPLGETSAATCMTYLSSQVLYLGSHVGDSQLLRIHPTPISNFEADTLPISNSITTVPPSSLSSSKGKEKADTTNLKAGKDGRIVSMTGNYVEVLESYQNIAPILDAVLADLDGSGQPQIVTCSGGRNTGALKIIRTGADFQELAVVNGIPGVTNMWPVRSRYKDSVDTHLVTSTLYETYVFSFDAADTMTRLEPSTAGFTTRLPTLALTNIPRRQTVTNGARTTSSYVDSSLVVQVTPEGVKLLEYDPALRLFSSVDEWSPEKHNPLWAGREIVAAGVNPSQFVLGLSGGRLVLLNLDVNGQLQFVKSCDFTDLKTGPKEIAAISCAPFDPSKEYSTYIALSFWGINKVTIISLASPDLTPVCETSALPSLPHSILLYNFGTGRRPKDLDYHPHVLVGLTDGTAVSYTFKDNQLKEHKVFSLGIAPVSLSTCVIDGKTGVFASGSRASVLYWGRQRVHQSPIMLKDSVQGASLSTSAFPSCLILATSSSLLIGNVRGVDKMQITTIPMGLENPHRIAHHSGLKMFGVACSRTAPVRIGDFENTFSSFQLLDDSSFKRLDSFTCDADEEVSAVLALPADASGPSFCLGTVRFQQEEQEPSEGRIIVLGVNSTSSLSSTPSKLQILASETVNGCVYALACVRGMIAVAVNSAVVLFQMSQTDGTSETLKKVASWNHNYCVTTLVADGDTLVVGDAISSVSILKVEAGPRLQAVARDYGPLWPVAVGSLGHGGVIGANSDCNLFTFVLQRNDNRPVLERDGDYHLGDVVNKFLPGGVVSGELSGDELLKQNHLFFTSTGRIGTVLDMADEMSLHMTALQRNMAKFIIGPGDTHHAKWRAPSSSKGHSDAEASFGFLDGDFLEQFLTYPHPDEILQGEVEAERITLPTNHIHDVLEKIQSLH